jgi:hypothetical protein
VVRLDKQTLMPILEQRDQLYRQLLSCFVEQRLLLDGSEWEPISARFLPLVDESNQLQQKIEAIQQQLEASKLDGSATNTTLQLIQEVQQEVAIIHVHLSQFAQFMGQNLMSVKNQQRVMNAYYHLQNREQVPLYFDEKK